MRISKLLILALALNSTAFAEGIKVVGTIDQSLNSPAKNTFNSKAQTQHIKLLKMQVSPNALKVIGERSKAVMSKPYFTYTASKFPGKIELGMNDVPVLNQGSFGSCVTFATTAAVDAALNKGDYISQLCQLQLGLYLEKNGYSPSGWNGSLGRAVLSQMELFGIVSKDKQRSVGCGGLTEYPQTEQPSADSAMNPEQFRQLSESLENSKTFVNYSPILDVYQAVLDRTDTNKTVNDIKAALNEKDRVIFAVMLLDFDLGTMGAVGTHNAKEDSWVLTPEIARDIYLRPQFGGHEMIITGYDDNAIAIDDQGREHKGLFTLRNSWSEQFGDKGNFYMSYDYFKVLVIEAQRIRAIEFDAEEDSETATA